MSPSKLIPRVGPVNMMSNSAVRKGAATLFLTTLARTRPPTISWPTLSCSTRRRSIRTEE